MDRDRDDASTTTVAILLSVGLIATAGFAIGIGSDDDAASQTATADDGQPATATTHTVDWEGQLATEACVPAGPYTCYGASVGEADDHLDTGIATGVDELSLELAWDARTPATEELALRVLAGHSEDCGQATCYYWETLATAQGTAPVTLATGDLAIDGPDTLWLVVDKPDDTPDPLYSDAHTEQAFHVTGEIVTAGSGNH